MEAAKQQRMADRQKAYQAKYKMTMEKGIDDNKVWKNIVCVCVCDWPMHGRHTSFIFFVPFWSYSISKMRRIAISTISIRTFRLHPKTSKSKINITNTLNTLRTKRWVDEKKNVKNSTNCGVLKKITIDFSRWRWRTENVNRGRGRKLIRATKAV